MSFAVRRLGKGDAAAYQEIRLEGLRLEPAAFGGSLDEEAGKSLEEVGARLGRDFTFGVFDGQSLVGIATFYVEAMQKTKHRGHVAGVYVKPSARGTGAAMALMEALINVARGEVMQLHLVVTQQNERSRRFYERLGFSIYGSDPRGLNVDGRYYDDYLMVLRLDEGGTESDRQ